MKYYLSATEKSTFVGDVFPLWLCSDTGESLSKEDISFTASDDALTLRSFKGEGSFAFANGVLVTVKKAGESRIACTYKNERFVCTVNAHPMKKATSEEATLHLFGDMHAHTTMIHDPKRLPERTSEFPEDYLEAIKADGRLDFTVMSDHAETINDEHFFRCFRAEETARPMPTIIFPGSESEVVYFEKNRLDIPVRKSGEILVLNADGYILAKDFPDFIDTFKNAPEPIGIFAHPQVVGWGEPPTAWDFNFPKIATPEMKHIIRGIEVLDGAGANLAFEQSYSYALDAGLRVSPYGDSDAHQDWSFDHVPHKTVAVVTEKSKEAILDALRSGRVYTTESGNLKMTYEVNGKTAPADLAPADAYRFRITLDTFDGNENDLPISCRVISDYGKTVMAVNCKGKKTLEFTVFSETARYFYLRFMDANGKRAFSCPVYTGRDYDKWEETPLSPIDMSACAATETVAGEDAADAINGDPFAVYKCQKANASILIDMKESKTVSALGHYPTPILRKPGLTGADLEAIAASIPADYAVYTSVDGIHFDLKADGYCRVFADENIIRFPVTEARYVRFDVLTTTGKYSENPEFSDVNVSIGNLTIFE